MERTRQLCGLGENYATFLKLSVSSTTEDGNAHREERRAIGIECGRSWHTAGVCPYSTLKGPKVWLLAVTSMHRSKSL